MDLVPTSLNLELNHCAFHSTICLNYVWVIVLYLLNGRSIKLLQFLKLVIDRVSTTIGQYHYCVALLRFWSISYLTKLLVLWLLKSQFSSLDFCDITLPCISSWCFWVKLLIHLNTKLTMMWSTQISKRHLTCVPHRELLATQAKLEVSGNTG